MRTIPARHVGRPAADRESLPEVWDGYALRATRAAQVVCIALGVIGVATLLAIPPRWACIPLALVVVGTFGLHAVAAQQLIEPLTPRANAALTALRAFADLVAILALIAAVLSALILVFGGSVGIMRV